eukprot:303178-Lingulodinium_polyedra.AAC.1
MFQASSGFIQCRTSHSAARSSVGLRGWQLSAPAFGAPPRSWSANRSATLPCHGQPKHLAKYLKAIADSRLMFGQSAVVSRPGIIDI